MRVEWFDITTSAGGAFTETKQVVAKGRIVQVLYVPDGTSPLDTGAQIVLTGATTGQPILTQASLGTSLRRWAPRQATHAVADGSASLYAVGGEPVEAEIAVKEPLKLVVSSGGATKAGDLYVYIDDASR